MTSHVHPLSSSELPSNFCLCKLNVLWTCCYEVSWAMMYRALGQGYYWEREREENQFDEPLDQLDTAWDFRYTWSCRLFSLIYWLSSEWECAFYTEGIFSVARVGSFPDNPVDCFQVFEASVFWSTTLLLYIVQVFQCSDTADSSLPIVTWTVFLCLFTEIMWHTISACHMFHPTFCLVCRRICSSDPVQCYCG